MLFVAFSLDFVLDFVRKKMKPKKASIFSNSYAVFFRIRNFCLESNIIYRKVKNI